MRSAYQGLPGYEKSAIDDIKDAMKSGGWVSKGLGSAQGMNTLSTLNGSTTAVKASGFLNNPVVGLIANPIDAITGKSSWEDANKDTFDKYSHYDGVETEAEANSNNASPTNNHNGNGLLASLKNPTNTIPDQSINQGSDIENIDPYNTGWANQSSRFNFTF